jgi:alpha-1,3-rhamnosyl/mannosyltransferase
VTVNDIGPLVHPEYFRRSRRWIMEATLKRVLRRADRIVAISDATASELTTWARESLSSRLMVIPMGVSERVFNETTGDDKTVALDTYSLKAKKYFLCVGSMNPRKNLDRVISAFELIALPDHDLVVLGGPGWDHEDTLERVKRSAHTAKIRVLGNIPDHTLRTLYQNASALVFPSLYEGFGMPVIEAMACGCPVITSHLSPMKEISHGVSMLVDPTRVEDIAAAMNALADEATPVRSMVRSGLERSKRYSWATIAGEYHRVYQDLV